MVLYGINYADINVSEFICFHIRGSCLWEATIPITAFKAATGDDKDP